MHQFAPHLLLICILFALIRQTLSQRKQVQWTWVNTICCTSPCHPIDDDLLWNVYISGQCLQPKYNRQSAFFTLENNRIFVRQYFLTFIMTWSADQSPLLTRSNTMSRHKIYNHLLRFGAKISWNITKTKPISFPQLLTICLCAASSSTWWRVNMCGVTFDFFLSRHSHRMRHRISTAIVVHSGSGAIVFTWWFTTHSHACHCLGVHTLLEYRSFALNEMGEEKKISSTNYSFCLAAQSYHWPQSSRCFLWKSLKLIRKKATRSKELF